MEKSWKSHGNPLVKMCKAVDVFTGVSPGAFKNIFFIFFIHLIILLPLLSRCISKCPRLPVVDPAAVLPLKMCDRALSQHMLPCENKAGVAKAS